MPTETPIQKYPLEVLLKASNVLSINDMIEKLTKVKELSFITGDEKIVLYAQGHEPMFISGVSMPTIKLKENDYLLTQVMATK